MKPDLLEYSKDELRALFAAEGFPTFRAGQVYGWLMKAVPFAEMSNLPVQMREKLADIFSAGTARVQEVFASKNDGSRKILFALSDGNIVEGVLMRHSYGNTFCVSSQVGCAMGCAFCASTIGGLVRNLTAGEMLHMTLLANAMGAEDGKEHGRGVTNVVIMGSGEPLLNYENVVKFLRLVSAEGGINISPRNISLSTCGIVPAILRLMDEGLPITLAISLHAPSDDIRSQIMPVNRQFSIEDIRGACVEYIARTKRRIVFEYALIDGLNSRREHAEALARYAKGMMCHVNLIALNPVEESPLKPASKTATSLFLKTLTDKGISATTRRSMGSDIEGACGQLRRRFLEKTGENGAD